MNTKKIIAALVAFTAAATLGACTNPGKEIAPSKDKTPAPTAQPTSPAPTPTIPAPAPTTPAPNTPAPTNPTSPRVPVTQTPVAPQLGQGSGFYGYASTASQPTFSDGDYGYSTPDNTVSADTSHAAAQARFAIKGLGYSQAPVVAVRSGDGAILETWGGFRPDRIEKAAALVAA